MATNRRRYVSSLALSALVMSAIALARPARADDPQNTGGGYVLKGNTEGQVTRIVSQFELNYMNKNKDAMIRNLMVPTTDATVLKRRSQWLRGYGKDEKPETAHPPILFASQEGSFFPKSYSVNKVKEVDRDHWKAIVNEMGPYKDDKGTFKVKRTRYFTIVRYKDNKWYVQDYTAKEGQNEYAFAVDESVDTLTKEDK